MPQFVSSSPPLGEYLVVFATLFLAGYLWATCIHWYIQLRVKARLHG